MLVKSLLGEAQCWLADKLVAPAVCTENMIRVDRRENRLAERHVPRGDEPIIEFACPANDCASMI
jgi:hypothetical protein